MPILGSEPMRDELFIIVGSVFLPPV